MIGLLLLIALGAWALYRTTVQEIAPDIPHRLSEKIDKLWDIVQDSLRDRKYLRAEKALLTILRVDERNATAYNRLGIIYAKQRAYKDAIECFEIAQSLEPSASNLHNVGLIYYETEQYEKAALAFEQALAVDEAQGSRHIAYAKVQEKLGHEKKMFTALERAVAIEPTIQSYKILADAYERYGQSEQAAEMQKKLKSLVPNDSVARRVTQQRRVNI